MPTADQIDSIANLGGTTIAIITLAVALYIFATSFKKIADSQAMQASAWKDMSVAVAHLTDAIKDLKEMFKDTKCPYLQNNQDKK